MELICKNPTVNFHPYGSILFTKNQANKIGGYNEAFNSWGGDDDDFRRRLVLAGFKKRITLAKLLHANLKRHEINGSQTKKAELTTEKTGKKLETIQKQKNYLANNGQFGQAYKRIIFDYSPHKHFCE
jgi:hypothetical protein